MGHHHHHTTNDRSLKWAIGLNVMITTAQIIGGLWVASMALISDALHNFMDVTALVISLIAIQLSKKPSTHEKSFGYKRAQTLAALVNSVSIVVVALIILIESSRRLFIGNQEVIQGLVVIWLAGLAILINGISAWILHKDAQHDMNMKSAFLHLISDTLFSAAVMAGGILIYYKSIYWIDSVLSILIAVYLIYSSWPLIKKSVSIIMQFAPTNVNLDQLRSEVEELDGVINIHHVHIWELDEHNIHMEGHLDLEPRLNFEEVCTLLATIENKLKENFNIAHVTLQPETGQCKDPELVSNH